MVIMVCMGTLVESLWLVEAADDSAADLSLVPRLPASFVVWGRDQLTSGVAHVLEAWSAYRSGAVYWARLECVQDTAIPVRV